MISRTWAARCAERHVAAFAGKTPDREPPDLPWLAVYVLPHALALPPETVTMLGDLDRCLAGALIESE